MYNFGESEESLNHYTPADPCSVKYKDLDHAINACIKLLNLHGWGNTLYFSKTDIKSAFRLVPILVGHRCWLVMKATNPITGEEMFFIDMCLPFGVSISCTIFQAFSDALNHLIEYLLKLDDTITNYLDDFLFVAILRENCDAMMRVFVQLCEEINCPLSEEKTEWASVVIVFLRTLLDGKRH